MLPADFYFPCVPAGCLRDLQRFFRHDDPEARPGFFAVSKYNFARSDLVPLIVTYPEDYDVVYNAREYLNHTVAELAGRFVVLGRGTQRVVRAVLEACCCGVDVGHPVNCDASGGLFRVCL